MVVAITLTCAVRWLCITPARVVAVVTFAMVWPPGEVAAGGAPALFVVGDSWATLLGPTSLVKGAWLVPSHDKAGAALANNGIAGMTPERITNLSVPGSTAGEWRADNPCYNEPLTLPHRRCAKYRGLLSRLSALLQETDARLPLVYLSLGAGDLLSDAVYWLGPRKGLLAVYEQLEEDLDSIVAELVAANPSVLIIIPGYGNFNPNAQECDRFLGPWQVHLGTIDARELNRMFFGAPDGLSEVYRRVSAAWPGNVVYADVHATLTSFERTRSFDRGVDWFKPSARELWLDCLHPNAYTTEVFATAVVGEALRQVNAESESALPPASDRIERDSFVFDSNRRNASHEIYRMSRRGDHTTLVQLTDDPGYESWWAKVSPDRAQVLFQRTPVGVDDDADAELSLWLMNADGGQLKMLRGPAQAIGWSAQGHAEWSSDGTEIVVAGGPRGQAGNIWVLDAASGLVKRRVTHLVGGAAVDPSWSPDGRHIVFSSTVGSCAAEEAGCYEVHTVPADGTRVPVRHTYDSRADYAPYFSPDGTHVAWVSVGEDDAWGDSPSGLRLASFTEGRPFRYACWIIHGGGVYSSAEWDEAGTWLWSQRHVPGHPQRLELYRVAAECNADATAVPLEPPTAGVHRFPDLH